MDVGALFSDVPLGWSVQVHDGRRYGVTRSLAAGGRVQKLYAEALDGSDVVSANLYLVGGRHELKPCEMPSSKVLEFLEGLDWAAPT